jgi:ubiquitin carboxyl-terminal hydrolase 8
MSLRNVNAEKGLVAQPPFLRWISIYGEEICAAGTHLEVQSVSDRPATLAYEVGGDRAPVEVLKPYGSMLGAGFIRESLRGVPPAPGSVGLQNLGNSCFLNSVIQCLNQIEPLTKYFLSDNYVTELNRYNPLGSGGNVAVAYASLVREMWSGEYSILAPRLLKQTVSNFAPQFNNSYQHDSHEFCSFLMDGLHEDLNRVKTKPYVEELEGLGLDDAKIAIESWRRHLLRHDSIIVDYCQGMHRSHLTCPGCGKESLKFDVFSSISLPLAPPKERTAVSLTECIEQFMEGEQLDEANAWYCPSCKKHVCALKMIALWSVPDILIFQLKRFTFSTSSKDSAKVLRSKVDCLVQFPLDKLDLRKYILGPIDEDAPPVYKLFGVSEHSGTTANSGHYTATVRNSQDGQWYRYNDSHVGETSGDAAVTGGAYLLFYQRSKGSLRWGGLEKVMKDRSVNPYNGLETDQDGFTQVKTKKKKKGKV